MFVTSRGGTVYHYTRLDIGIDCIIARGEFQASPLSKTNDPYEFKQRAMGVSFGIVEQPRLPRLDVSGRWLQLLDSQTKLLSFCMDSSGEPAEETAFAPGFAKPRMWAQYAANHSGVCIGFNTEKLLSGFDASGITTVHVDQIRPEIAIALPFAIYGHVGYGLPPRTGALALSNRELENGDLERLLLRKLLSRAREVLFTKAKDWSTENEYRVVVVSRNDGCEMFPVRDAIESVTLGARTLTEEEDLFAILRPVQCHLYRMDWQGGVPRRGVRNEQYFLGKRLIRLLSEEHRRLTKTPTLDHFIGQRYEPRRRRLYRKCVSEQPFIDSSDVSMLMEWIAELEKGGER